MNPIHYFTDDESGVSPVIGVILMVAITVILAAVIATFVLGLGEQISDTAPSASFSYDLDDDDLTITHTGGQALESGTVTIEGDLDSGSPYDWDSDISAGNSTERKLNDKSDRSVQVVWDSPDGDQSAVLSEWSE